VIVGKGGKYRAKFTCTYSKYAIVLMSMNWTVETLNETVNEELEALPWDMKARFSRVVELIETFGLNQVGPPHIKHLEGSLWEIRLTGKSGISRALYVAVKQKRVVVVRVFVKKTQKTPRREIKIALERAKEIKK